MAETLQQVVAKLQPLLQPGYRNRLTSRGAARAMVWRAGVLPSDGPQFAQSLTQDLISYGFGLLRTGLKAKELNILDENVLRSFEVAGESIEAVVRNGDPEDLGRGFYRIVAAASYHLARFSARAYSLIGQANNEDNLNTIEKALSLLILRQLDNLYQLITSHVTDAASSDESILQKLESPDDDFDIDDALVLTATDNYLRALAAFLFALRANQENALSLAEHRLTDGEALCFNMGLINMWWIYRLTRFLIGDLWKLSIQRLLPQDLGDKSNWPRLRNLFVASLAARGIGELDLWPSQLEIAARVSDTRDHIVASLPTSAGKTRIAELCILRALSSGHRVVFVTPLRALSAQTERTLRRTFGVLGFEVSSLYGSAGASSHDIDSLANRHIVVSTPEKLDFALRNNPSLLDDVSLVVLDEGHMLGPTEREVRYEVLIQRLLRRSDADKRRIVCLSAMLPSGAEMDDFASWLRNDSPGDPITGTWRPTRQRFGHIIWDGTAAKYELNVEDEVTFIHSFVKLQEKLGPRRGLKKFPDNLNDLVLASAWRLAEENLAVLIYCPEKRSVNAVAKRLLKAQSENFLMPLSGFELVSVEKACSAGKEWLGKDHLALKCLELGVALHHGGLPKPYVKEIDTLIAAKQIRIIIASPTLARGLNISASCVLFQSVFRYDTSQATRLPISVEEFSNVAGRAGRAYVDLDGQAIGVCFDRHQLLSWQSLVHQQHKRSLESGLLSVVIPLLELLEAKLGKKTKDITEYVLNSSNIWVSPLCEEDKLPEWNRAVDILDIAILSLIGEEDCTPDNVALILDKALTSSFLRRRLKSHKENTQHFVEAVLNARAKYICSTTSPKQRRGYFFSGVGLATGKFMDTHADDLHSNLLEAEDAIDGNDAKRIITAVTNIAECVFNISPFMPSKLPDEWKKILTGWLKGRPITDLEELSDDAAAFVEDGLVYRLTWALEAIRVRSRGIEESLFDDKPSRVAAFVETGTMSSSQAILLQSGLSSRIAAAKSLKDCPDDFATKKEMWEWLTSDAVTSASKTTSWPTSETRSAWIEFVRSQLPAAEDRWGNYESSIEVSFNEGLEFKAETPVFVWQGDGRIEIFTPDLVEVGQSRTPLGKMPLSSAIGQVVDHKTVRVNYIGPVK